MPKVLIVDDDPNNRLLLSSILRYEQHTVVEAANGAEGLEALTLHRPDLVIVDLNMPDVDGVTFVRSLRANEQFATTAIALSTGTTLNAAMEDFLELYNVRTVIPKPSEPEEIIRRIRGALS